MTINRRLLAIGDNTTALLITSSVDGGKELTVKAKNNGAKPTVNILETNVIDSVTYRIRCEVESDGGMEVTERGICWNTFGTPTMDDETKPNSSGGTGEYTIRMEHLTMATHYYVRAYAKNQFGTGFSEVVDFVTGDVVTPPTVATVEVKDVTATSAVCKGNVTTDGGTDLLERGVCWGSTANPTVNEQHHAASSASVGEFSVSITGLTANTTYHVRAYAKNSKGTAYGRDLTFTTTNGQPTVTTASVTNITATSAKCGGTVTDQGASNVTERGVCWGTSHNPTLDNDHASSGTGAGSFTVNMTGLTPNKTYYVRAYAKNAQGIAYGSEVSFKALEGLPVVTTADVTNVTSMSAKGGGNVTDQGGSAVTERGVCWNTDPNPTLSDNHASSGTGTGSYTVSLTDLVPETKYYVRAYAINTQGTAYGEQKEFSTTAIPTFTVSVMANPATGGTVTGGGPYQEGQSCTVTATPNAGYVFLKWTENGNQVSTDANYTFTVSGNCTLVAQFDVVIYTISTSSNPADGGTTSGSGSYQEGGQCTVTATPATGYDFTEWTENGASVSTSASYSFTVTGDRTLVANFTPKTYTITVSANPANGGNVSGGGTYSYGQQCTVTASPIAEYHFAIWAENGISISEEASYTFTVTGDRNLVARFSDAPIGAVDGLFTVNANGDQVYFSKGNLQYIGSSNTWKFADHQWDAIGENQNNSSQTATRDLFGWGTSGWNCGNTYYRPYDTNNSYGRLYGPPGSNNLTGSYANSDWGIYNAISNGGNQAGLWRTLTNAEWKFVFDTREGTWLAGEAHARYAKAMVNGMAGVILFPDGYSHPNGVPEPTNINNLGATFTGNNYQEGNWSAMERAGCVFLPAAGLRYGTSVDYIGTEGYYWSASYNNSDNAYDVSFHSSDLYPQNYYDRYDGFSVRLVRDAQ